MENHKGHDVHLYSIGGSFVAGVRHWGSKRQRPWVSSDSKAKYYKDTINGWKDSKMRGMRVGFLRLNGGFPSHLPD